MAPQARRIVNLQFKGQPLDDAMRFVVVTNNYRASGGGNLPAMDGNSLIMDAVDEHREALVQYLRAAGTLDPAADNIWHRWRPGRGLNPARARSARRSRRDRPGWPARARRRFR